MLIVKKKFKEFPLSKCPLDEKECNVRRIDRHGYEDDPVNPDRGCRYGNWNCNSESSPCGREIFRDKKKKSVKSKRKSKCGCVK